VFISLSSISKGQRNVLILFPEDMGNHLGSLGTPGIRPLPETPGFKEFVIKPSFFDILEQAHAEIQTPYGKVLSDWVSSDKGVTLAVEVPFNTRARIILPKNLSGHPAVTDSGGQEITISWKGPEAGFVLGSGRYTVEFQSGD